MSHFGTRRVKVISAVWSDGRPALRTNLDIFNAETGRGVSNEQAAFATKTGQWARAHGFPTTGSIETTPDDLPGGYEQVLVNFVKSSRLIRPRKKK
jgi:hypothetical protein